MEVDTETGRVTMRKYVCCDDIGNIMMGAAIFLQVVGYLIMKKIVNIEV